MAHVPDIPYFQIEVILAGCFVLFSGATRLWRVFKSDISPRKCILCSRSFPADDYARHLEMCAIKRVARLERKVGALQAKDGRILVIRSQVPIGGNSIGEQKIEKVKPESPREGTSTSLGKIRELL